MARKLNNKNLLILLVALGLVLGLTKWLGSGRKERNFDADVVAIDTAQVTHISIFPKAENQVELKFSKDASGWMVEKDGKKVEVGAGKIENVLAELLQIKPKRLAAKKEDQWESYQVSDSSGTRVVVKEGGKTTLDLVIGKFSYNQNPQQYN
ncbi:MAG: hypothetical protein HC842_03940, partial [Cytophagales bacterium]|nr:hypothetical protein [Cytophagales bacterium]